MTTTGTILVRDGSVYINSDLYRECFSGIETVALLRQGAGFLIVPVHTNASGGRLMKIRNARGDRVISAPDFCRDHGIDDIKERIYHAYWDEQVSALRVDTTEGA
jgi:hypothetical protein